MGISDKNADQSSYYSNSYEQSGQYGIDNGLFKEYEDRVKRGEKLGKDFDQSQQDLYNAATERINIFNKYTELQKKTEIKEIDYFNADGTSSYNVENAKKVVEALTNTPLLENGINWLPEVQNPIPTEAKVIIGGVKEVTATVTATDWWESSMGTLHGLAGAPGSYDGRTYQYKKSWDLANNAMKVLMGATEKIIETAPPVLPGRGPTPLLKPATVGSAARVATEVPRVPIFFSAGGNGSKQQEHNSNASNFNEPSKTVKFVNKTGKEYPKITDSRTGKNIHFPEGDLQKVPETKRVVWNKKTRGDYIKEWYERGYDTPEGGWEKYDIHHIQPREYGGTNEFNNLVPVERIAHQTEFTAFWNGY